MNAPSARGLFRATGNKPKPVLDLIDGEIVQLADGLKRDECWLPIDGWPGYEVSDLGRVRSWKWPSADRQWRVDPEREPRVLKPAMRNGYLAVGLADKERGQIQHNIHTLVLGAFVGAPPSLTHQGAHGDGIKTNNRVDNLSWKTPVENNADKILHGTHKAGERVGNARLTNAKAAEIRRRYRQGERAVSLAAEFRVGLSTAKKIIAGTTYRFAEGDDA